MTSFSICLLYYTCVEPARTLNENRWVFCWIIQRNSRRFRGFPFGSPTHCFMQSWSAPCHKNRSFPRLFERQQFLYVVTTSPEHAKRTTLSPTMPITFASFFQQQQTFIIPSIGKTESTDSTIDAKSCKIKSIPRLVTRSPSPTHEPVPARSIWRRAPTASSSYQSNGNSSDEESFSDMWTIRRCNAFEEDSDEDF